MPRAVFLRKKAEFERQTVVILLCGASITPQTLRSVL